MAKKRERRNGFVARWFRRIWWLRRVLVLGAVVGGAAKTLKSRGSGGGASGSSGSGGGPGGSGRPAPIGGPYSPTRSAAATPPPSEPETATAAAPAGGVRTLVSVPPLPDSDGAADTDGNDDAPPDAPVSGASLAAVADTADGATAPDSDRAWAEPLDDGGCPPSHPIKANNNSGIYHVPGGRFYERTVAERCYSTAEAAEADGYRPAKA
ncbi:MAG: hypothetical protein M3431_12970 [Actinomycetota bacterium]|nr:hypothetical protein [Actinomycetota bacterium]